MNGPVLVVGGTGRLGGLVAARLCSTGTAVRVLGRSVPHPGPPVAGLGPARPQLTRPRGGRTRPTLVHGDVRHPGYLPLGAFDGLQGLVVSVGPGTAPSGPDSPEATVFQGVCNVIDACRAAGGAPHVVLVSQIYVTRRDHPTNMRANLLDWRLRGEEVLRASGLPYTVVRPGWLTSTHAAGHGVRLEQGDTGEGRVSREDVADACVAAMTEPAALGTTFELFNTPGPAPDWPGLLSGLAPDRVLAYR